MSFIPERLSFGFLLSWKFWLNLFIAGFVLGVVSIVVFLVWLAAVSRDLPSVAQLVEYEPPIMSRVHAGDGTLIAEFADEHRVFVPFESIPQHVVQAFIAAEDKNFFEHEGVDWAGLARGVLNSAKFIVTRTGGLQGGSTITQQVVKNMLLSRDQTIIRKIKEMILANRIERAFTKEEIIELYLNDIYLGGRSYGVGAAALNYFDKSLPELNISEAAILASLPKFPGRVNPYTNPRRLLQRRDYVINRMVDDSYISVDQAAEAKALPLTTKKRLRGREFAAATYFVQELRRQLIGEFGEKMLEQGGLSIRSTIDTRLQLTAQEALRNGLNVYDRRKSYRGPLTELPVNPYSYKILPNVDLPRGYGDWERAFVESVGSASAVIVLEDGAKLPLESKDVEWAAKTFQRDDLTKGLRAGDVVLVEVKRREDEGKVAKPYGKALLRQVPEVEGALLAIDPHTGRILAMAGGYSFFKSPFNRATQARRQPGSAFKPFVYAAALEQGYTPATKVLDAPFVEYDFSKEDYWAPVNYSEGNFYGLSTIRLGLEKSRNLMTVRMAQDIGMPRISDLAVRVGIYNSLEPFLAMSLGAGETSLWNMSRAYAALVNGGFEVTPTLIDRIQDRHGRTLFKHDKRECYDCQMPWDGGPPPDLTESRAQVIDPITSYQVVSMLQGVIERGTGSRVKKVGKPIAGKTGTTNDFYDATFYGFSPDLVVGVWVGHDAPQSLGNGESGGKVAAPIFAEFMKKALKDEPALPFRKPDGVRLVQIDARTGELPSLDSEVVITEAFRPGTEPRTNLSQITTASFVDDRITATEGILNSTSIDDTSNAIEDSSEEEQLLIEDNLDGGIY